MGYKVDNAVIMAAGISSRFAPLSYETPKALIKVKGEVLIERQIKQLKDAGIEEIIVVTGYKKEQFKYLKSKYGVILIENNEYLTRNNNSSIFAVKDYLKNTYICSADNYFIKNPFEKTVNNAYYAAVYAEGETAEWCMEEDEDGNISKISIGGKNAWYMLGHAFWSHKFSRTFVKILEEIYDFPETKDLLWEGIFMAHLDVLKMKIKKYPGNYIFEFDTLDELRSFDTSYIKNTRSKILQRIARSLKCREENITEINVLKSCSNTSIGFAFKVCEEHYKYLYETKTLRKI